MFFSVTMLDDYLTDRYACFANTAYNAVVIFDTCCRAILYAHLHVSFCGCGKLSCFCGLALAVGLTSDVG